MAHRRRAIGAGDKKAEAAKQGARAANAFQPVTSGFLFIVDISRT